MSRLERKIKRSGLDDIAQDTGWHRGVVNKQQRSVNYYKGPSYVSLRFSPWLYDLDSVYWWDNNTSRINVYDRHDGDIFLELLLLDIFDGKIDPNDKESILKYTLI